jgi:hypothetical protein
MLLLLLVVNPYMFGYSDPREADTLVLMVFLTSAFIPIIAVALMKALGWVKTMQMSDRYERIGPYIVTGILYLSLYMHIVKSNAFPGAFRVCTLGTIFALFAAFFVNNFMKISIHAVAMGGLVSLAILIKLFYGTDYFELPLFGERLSINSMYLLFTIIGIAGVVCTARMLLKQHVIREIYLGFAIGFICQLISYRILL